MGSGEPAVAAAMDGRRTRRIEQALGTIEKREEGHMSFDVRELFIDVVDLQERLDELQKLIKQQARGAAPAAVAAPPQIEVMDIETFLMMDIPPLEMVLDPIIPQKGLSMLYAERGTGKT